MTGSKSNTLIVSFIGLAAALTTLAPGIHAQDGSRDEKRWQAVAPGRVEPVSGEIKIGAPVVGRISDVLVKPNDKVFAGELLVRLDLDEARARLVAADAQIALRKRARNDQAASARASDRRKAEDAVFDSEKAAIDAQASVDEAGIGLRAGNRTIADLEAARTALRRAQDRLRVDKAELRKLEADSTVPLPNANEGQLNVARTEWLATEMALEKMQIRTPIAATVLQVNTRTGEVAAPGTPLLVVGDLSALRVRTEVDERDFKDVKIGQAVVIRAAAFRGQEFAGTVSAIAPIVDSGRINSGSQRNLTDVNVVEVIVDVAEPGPLTVGMKVDVYFRQAEAAQRQ
jgi:HlyD family secretion protein